MVWFLNQFMEVDYKEATPEEIEKLKKAYNCYESEQEAIVGRFLIMNLFKDIVEGKI